MRVGLRFAPSRAKQRSHSSTSQCAKDSLRGPSFVRMSAFSSSVEHMRVLGLGRRYILSSLYTTFRLRTCTMVLYVFLYVLYLLLGGQCIPCKASQEVELELPAFSLLCSFGHSDSYLVFLGSLHLGKICHHCFFRESHLDSPTE